MVLSDYLGFVNDNCSLSKHIVEHLIIPFVLKICCKSKDYINCSIDKITKKSNPRFRIGLQNQTWGLSK